MAPLSLHGHDHGLKCLLTIFFLRFYITNLFLGWDDEADTLGRAESLKAESETQRVL